MSRLIDADALIKQLESAGVLCGYAKYLIEQAAESASAGAKEEEYEAN